MQPIRTLQTTAAVFRIAPWTRQTGRIFSSRHDALKRHAPSSNASSTFTRQFTRQFTAGYQQEDGMGDNVKKNGGKDASKDAGKESAKGGKQAVKIPKGTRDWVGPDYRLREKIFQTANDVFALHGATPLDTPVFELKHILAGKYGEDSRLIYDLADQGGESCALRYDLTVPFARWLAMNNVQQIKRYQISKVYRRDQPAIARGRMREFYQCDFDIAGEYEPMIPDSEILRIILEVFEGLGLKEQITVKVNHRKVLDGLFAVAGVPEDKIRTISSAVDKLDKMPWEEVKKEMEEKGLAADVADVIGEYTQHSGGANIIELLRSDARASANEMVKKGLDEMELLFTYLDAYQASDKVSFDLSLARGLDYYTGLIFEVVMELPASARQDGDSRIGSIAAGGRYDNLVGMYGKRQIPCVGVSFGVDRIYTILQARHEKEKQPKPRGVDVFVMAFGGKNGLLPERMAVARELWDSGFRAEFQPKVKPKLAPQFKAAEAAGVPLVVILGEDELAAGKLKLKVMGLPDGHPEKEGRLIDRKNLADEVRKVLPTD